MKNRRNPPFRIRVHEERAHNRVKYSFASLDGETMWFEIVGDTPPPRPETDDFALWGMIFLAMRNGVDLHVEGTGTEECIHNLYEFQDIWATWLPEECQRISLSADKRVSVSRPMQRTGVFSFSGGVDSAAILTRNLDEDWGERRIKPAAIMTIQGFDVPIMEEAWFAATDEHNRKMLAHLNLPYYVVRTNYRTLIKANHDELVWGYQAGAGLFASFHLFSEIACYGVMGANEDYAHVVFPWGRGPLSDHLGGNARFRIRTECSDLNRCERIALIAKKQPLFASQLRVCWQKINSHFNCGRCEKCVRTHLNFIAIGREPLGFPEKLKIRDMFSVPSYTDIRMGFLYEIQKTAREHDVALKWRVLIFLLMAKNEILNKAWRIKKWGRSIFR